MRQLSVVTVNDTWLGKYRLVAELGHGGMADVFLAMSSGPSGSGFVKLAVLKKVRASFADHPDFIAMLVEEARISARLNHPNVVQTIEVGVEGASYFMAMEYLDGQSFHRVKNRAEKLGTPLLREAELIVVHDMLAGLHYAHELTDYDGTPLDIVHRDVTPQNLFVTYEGQVKVVDFGIAKASGSTAETQQGIVKGKIRYMSPEQASGLDVDRRSDIFSAGIMLWEAATQRRFWDGIEELQVVQRLVSGYYEPSPRAIDASVPEAIDLICCRALAFEREDRYPSAAAMQSDLEDFLARQTTSARRALGPLVAELFAGERIEMRSVIEEAGRRSLERLAPSSLDAPLARADNTSVQPFTLVMGPRPPLRDTEIDQPPLVAAPKRRLSLTAALGAVACGAIGIAALVVPHRGASASGGPAHEPTTFVVEHPTLVMETRSRARPLTPPPSPVASVAPVPKGAKTSPPRVTLSIPPSTPSPTPIALKPKPAIDYGDPWMVKN